MLSKKRNEFEVKGWRLTPVEDFGGLCDFDCRHDDLNEFFREDCFLQKEELLNTTFALIEATVETFFPVALISLCNDAIKKEKIKGWLTFKNNKKIYPAYPAVKIARFGVQNEFQRKEIGSHTINMIKMMFITNNRTGCRFLTVDAYNEKQTVDFYEKNDFQVFSDKDKNKLQRAMFFDLKRFRPEEVFNV